MRRSRFLLPAVLALLAAFAPEAWARSLVIADFDSDIEVRADGSALITETLQVRFQGEWNGIIRELSLRHTTASGRTARLAVEVLSVTDAAGNALEHWLEGGGNVRSIRVRVPGARDATRTVVIRYRVENAIRYFRDGDGSDPDRNFDELYWNVTGNEWEIPIEAARARVTLPEGVEPLRHAAYTGYSGSTATEAETKVAGGTVGFRALRGLHPGEGLTVAVGWAPGQVEVVPERVASAAAQGSVLAIPLLAFLFMFATWKKFGRDPARRAVAVQYAPPEGLTPTELGTLVDHHVEMHDVTAALVDLAVRGYMDIEEKQESRLLGLMKSTEYTFHIRPTATGWSELKGHERRFLEALAQHGTRSAAPEWAAATAAAAPAASGPEEDADAWGGSGHGRWTAVKFSDLTDKFHEKLPGIRTAVYDQLITAGHYRRRPDNVKKLWIGLGVGVVVGSIFLGVSLDPTPWWAPSSFLIGAAGVLAGVIVFGFGLVMPARTEKGARAMEAALGFREFLAKVEEPRYRLMITSPQMFEQYLPHAMAFRVEGRWAKAFEGMFREPPGWYHGSTGSSGFAPTAFAGSMRGMSTAAGTALASSPGGSGSGGGGSSGGGSGGGGGGGW
jgi:hypothetical protein